MSKVTYWTRRGLAGVLNTVSGPLLTFLSFGKLATGLLVGIFLYYGCTEQPPITDPHWIRLAGVTIMFAFCAASPRLVGWLYAKIHPDYY